MKRNGPKKALLNVIVVVLAGLLVAGSHVAVFAAEDTLSAPSDSELEGYRLGPGDLVQVVVWKNKEVSGNFRVRPDGSFSMPLIGDIEAGGYTTDQISGQIERKLRSFIETPFVSTIVVEAASNRVYIVGEVAKPGTYPITGSLTALQALALAGGFTTFADKEKMILVRGSGATQKNIPLSYKNMLRNPGEESNPVLQRGDTLVVP
ncbi:MAG: polysaccharide biosynthesis/export family protein [Pseudomonadota bacterium]|jgi:polysaccharide export outer membrane protein